MKARQNGNLNITHSEDAKPVDTASHSTQWGIRTLNFVYYSHLVLPKEQYPLCRVCISIQSLVPHHLHLWWYSTPYTFHLALVNSLLLSLENPLQTSRPLIL